MSYYDHATMMALRLGPWAGDRGGKQGEPGQRRGGGADFSWRRAIGRLRLTLGRPGPGRRHRGGGRDASEPIPMADPAVEGDAPRKSW
ncbi:MAG: hypothetical protein Q8S27_23505 [Hoeflea sp.]|nr:hypothetical protein [Hoeflea sp.]